MVRVLTAHGKARDPAAARRPAFAQVSRGGPGCYWASWRQRPPELICPARRAGRVGLYPLPGLNLLGQRGHHPAYGAEMAR